MIGLMPDLRLKCGVCATKIIVTKAGTGELDRRHVSDIEKSDEAAVV